MSNLKHKTKHYIAEGTELEGKLTVDQNVVIDGKIEGSVEGKQEMIFETKGVMKGSVRAKIIIVKGKIQGNIFSNGKVEILPGGVLEGNISTPPGGIIVQQGGILNSDLKPYKSSPDRSDRLPPKPKNSILTK